MEFKNNRALQVYRFMEGLQFSTAKANLGRAKFLTGIINGIKERDTDLVEIAKMRGNLDDNGEPVKIKDDNGEHFDIPDKNRLDYAKDVQALDNDVMVINVTPYKNKYKALMEALYNYSDPLGGNDALVLDLITTELDKEFPDIAKKFDEDDE